jgi:hypothetical protein
LSWHIDILFRITRIYVYIKRSYNFVEQNFFGSFEPTDRWVPDLNDSLIDNKLNAMTFEEEDMIHDNSNALVFGIGKPKMCIKIDKATQTDETNNLQLGNTITVIDLILFMF